MDGRKRGVVFATGGKGKNEGGSGFEVLVNASRDGRLDAEIVAVVSNHATGGVYHRAQRLDIPFRCLGGPWEPQKYQEIVAEYEPDLICLSGWVKPVRGLDPKITTNIHPASLPEFGGKGMYSHYVHEAVMEAYHRGEIKQSAVSMHFVTPEYDAGPVFFRKLVQILPNDTPKTLAARVNKFEHIFQPVITNLVVNGDIWWDGVNPSSLKTPDWCLEK